MCTHPSGSAAISGRAVKVSFAAPRGGSFCELEQLYWYRSLDDVASLPTCFVIVGATPRHSARKKRLDIDQTPTRYKTALASTGCTPQATQLHLCGTAIYLTLINTHLNGSRPKAEDEEGRRLLYGVSRVSTKLCHTQVVYLLTISDILVVTPAVRRSSRGNRN